MLQHTEIKSDSLTRVEREAGEKEKSEREGNTK